MNNNKTDSLTEKSEKELEKTLEEKLQELERQKEYRKRDLLTFALLAAIVCTSTLYFSGLKSKAKKQIQQDRAKQESRLESIQDYQKTFLELKLYQKELEQCYKKLNLQKIKDITNEFEEIIDQYREGFDRYYEIFDLQKEEQSNISKKQEYNKKSALIEAETDYVQKMKSMREELEMIDMHYGRIFGDYKGEPVKTWKKYYGAFKNVEIESSELESSYNKKKLYHDAAKMAYNGKLKEANKVEILE